MTTDLNPNPAQETFPPNPVKLPTNPGLSEKEDDAKADRTDQVADHLAHKGAKVEQDFDKENSKLFSK